ncbi:hypothetical protein M885DRAFT_520349 [Pelagophyceae sp. CCMP2097]|nr:hypothetical protein M885DRAFT_520349 [Pelagophyceae sp. CCMP2097]
MHESAEQLEAEMKLLNWHKLANETALKAALMKTKQMKTQDRKNQRGAETLKAKAAWMQRVIEEEQAKPLQVSKEFVLSYQSRERHEEERLEEEVHRHIECLRRLRSQIEKRDLLKSKKEAYRQRKAQIAADAKSESRTSDRRARRDADADDAPARAPPEARGQGSLATVISSLDRLVDLERRIASLENDSIYDRVDAVGGASVSSSGAARGGAGRGTGLSFTKQRMPAVPGAASKDVYAVRMHAKKQPLGPATGGSALRRPVGFQRQPPNAASRQDEAINNWLHRKQQRQQGGRGPVQVPALGAASGKRGKNAAEQRFLDMKKGVEKRKDLMSKRLASNGPNVRRPASLGGRPPVKSSTGGFSRRLPGGPPRGSTTGTGQPRKVTQARTLPHIAGPGIKGARGVRQAW